MEHQFQIGDLVQFEYSEQDAGAFLFSLTGKIVEFYKDGDAVVKTTVGRVHVHPELLEFVN